MKFEIKNKLFGRFYWTNRGVGIYVGNSKLAKVLNIVSTILIIAIFASAYFYFSI